MPKYGDKHICLTARPGGEAQVSQVAASLTF